MLARLDPSLLLAAGASFIVGLMGYLIVRLWIRPILRYRMTKRRLGQELGLCLMSITSPDGSVVGDIRSAGLQEPLRHARRHGMHLVNCYENEIPYWYRLLLESRGESPPAASEALANLGKIRDPQQRRMRLEKACQAIRWSEKAMRRGNDSR